MNGVRLSLIAGGLTFVGINAIFGVFFSKVEDVDFRSGALQTLIWFSPFYILWGRFLWDAFREPAPRTGWDEAFRKTKKLFTRGKIIFAISVVVGCSIVGAAAGFQKLSTPSWAPLLEDLSWSIAALILAWGDVILSFRRR